MKRSGGRVQVQEVRKISRSRVVDGVGVGGVMPLVLFVQSCMLLLKRTALGPCHGGF